MMRKSVLWICILGILAFAQEAKCDDDTVIIAELENIAKLEFELLDDEGYMHSDKSKLGIKNIELLYIKQIEEHRTINKKLLSRLLSRAAWFFFKVKSERFENEQIKKYLLEAINLDPENYVAYYQFALVNEKENFDLYKEYLLKALKKNTDFVEVYFELINNVYKDNSNLEKREECKAKWTSNLGNYHPELWHFDICYPPRRVKVIVEDGNGGGKILETKEYYSKSDEKRFKLNISIE